MEESVSDFRAVTMLIRRPTIIIRMDITGDRTTLILNLIHIITQALRTAGTERTVIIAIIITTVSELA